MRKRIIIAVAIVSVFGGVSMFSACNKADEVPPRSKGYIKEYVLPAPPFLTPAERELVEEQRREYESLNK